MDITARWAANLIMSIWDPDMDRNLFTIMRNCKRTEQTIDELTDILLENFHHDVVNAIITTFKSYNNLDDATYHAYITSGAYA